MDYFLYCTIVALVTKPFFLLLGAKEWVCTRRLLYNGVFICMVAPWWSRLVLCFFHCSNRRHYFHDSSMNHGDSDESELLSTNNGSSADCELLSIRRRLESPFSKRRRVSSSGSLDINSSSPSLGLRHRREMRRY